MQCGSLAAVLRQYVWTHVRHASNSQKGHATFLPPNFSQQMVQVEDIFESK
jgi:hypothetical protein